MTISVPERNRAIKKLLQATYGGVNISVRAGTGTAYHWVDIDFMRMPEELRPFKNGKLREAHVLAVIDNAGIHISTFSGDGEYTGRCITIKVRGVPHDA